MRLKEEVDVSKYPIGALVARFQVHDLHKGQREFLELVCKNHKKVIVLLGVPPVANTRSNPLDFATRKAMIQNDFPNVIVLPIKDMRSNKLWSKSVDNMLKQAFGNESILLYGSRDSFIPYYSGSIPTLEVITDTFFSGTEVRKSVSEEILGTSDFRAGVIHATYARYAITFPTVDVVAFNEEGNLLLCKKPNEPHYRFIGGFVDTKDTSSELAARREFNEETGGCEIGDLQYVASGKILDWRFTKEDAIMTTLFIGKFISGSLHPSDDIDTLHWISPEVLTERIIQPEHQELMKILMNKIDNGTLKSTPYANS
jgi:bifunctional NMN adenylyltransferase/nudix hydrolase